jgi:hypothetical protein
LGLSSGGKDAYTMEKKNYDERGRAGQQSLTWKQCYCMISYLYPQCHQARSMSKEKCPSQKRMT